MGRPRNPPGTWGKVWVSDNGAPYKARARIRDWNGDLVPIARFGQTKTAARNALLAALRDYQATARGAHIDPSTPVKELAEMWLRDGKKTNGETWSTNTAETYQYVVANEVIPALGGIQVRELKPALINRAIAKVSERNGSGAAKTMKTALSGMCKLAIAHEALTTNPLRDAISISRERREPVRALTTDEMTVMTDLLRSDPRAVAWDVPDLVDWMLGTGVRIGEALATRAAVLDPAAATVEINATVIREKGAGLHIQEWTKTDAGWRVLALPSYLILMLERRRSELRLSGPDGVVFASPRARALRDPSNTSGDLREVFDRVGCPDCGGRGWHPHLKTEKQRMKPPRVRIDRDANRWGEPCAATPPFAWVHSHVFRKTVLTRLDDAGLTPREIADYAGHAKPSMTQDVYMGRNVVSAKAARVLDR